MQFLVIGSSESNTSFVSTRIFIVFHPTTHKKRHEVQQEIAHKKAATLELHCMFFVMTFYQYNQLICILTFTHTYDCINGKHHIYQYNITISYK